MTIARDIRSLNDLLRGTAGQRPIWRGGRWTSARMPYVELEDYAPSVTDDWTDALLAANTDAVARGRCSIIAPPDAAVGFDISGPVALSSGVTLQGAGGSSVNPGTRFVAQDASACLTFGARASGSYGGESGGFMLDGNGLAPTMLYLGRTLERSFHNIAVRNCAAGGSAVLFEETQNCQFFGLWIGNNDGDNITFDRGAAGNRIYGLESHEAGGAAAGGLGGREPVHLRFIATGTGISGLTLYPMNNQIFGGIIERDGGNLEAYIWHGAGAENALWGVNIAAGSNRSTSAIKMLIADAGVTSQSRRLYYHGGYLSGIEAWTTAFDLDDGASLYIPGNPLIQGFLNQYRFRDTQSLVFRPGYHSMIAPADITNEVSADSVGTIAQELVQLTKLKVVNRASLGSIGVGNSAAATTLGAVTKKIEVFNQSGVSLGYIAVFDGIS